MGAIFGRAGDDGGRVRVTVAAKGSPQGAYIDFEMSDEFFDDFEGYCFGYDADRYDQIPLELIDRFNELTLSGTWISWP